MNYLTSFICKTEFQITSMPFTVPYFNIASCRWEPKVKHTLMTELFRIFKVELKFLFGEKKVKWVALQFKY